MKNDGPIRERRKPEFTREGCIWSDEDYIPEKLSHVLRDELRPRRWTKETTDEFMRVLGDRVHMADEGKEKQAQAVKRKSLRAVEKAAHRLLLALEALQGQDAHDDLETYVRWLARVHRGNPPFTLSDHTSDIARIGPAVGGWWDVVYDIERAAGYTCEKVVAGKGMRLNQQHARRLVNAAASTVRDVTGHLPKTSKGSWFPEFARLLCEGFDALPCGVELVSEVVKEMQPTG